MKKNMLYIILLLTAAWIILVESFTVPLLAAGLAISAGCLYIYHRFLPLPKITNINLLRLTLYQFYLIGQLYLSAFSAIKLMLRGAGVDIIEVKTGISNDFLQTILANSVTLTPGSISLDLKDDKISILLLKGKTEGHAETQRSGEAMINRLEKILIKAER